ncbi:hypothetical protein GCM10027049_09850 [Mucilaginibacter puniceus]
MPTNRVIATIPLNSRPEAIAVSPDNLRVYVCEWSTNTIAEIDALTNTVIGRIAVGNKPMGLSLNFDGSKMYVCNTDGTISVINTVTKTVVSTINIDPEPLYTLLSNDDKTLYVIHRTLHEIEVINTATSTVTARINIGANAQGGMVLSPDGTRLYASNWGDKTVSIINTTTSMIIGTIPVGPGPFGLSVSDNGNLLYVSNSGDNTMSVVNTTSLTVTSTFNLGGLLYSTGNLYVPHADCSQPITFNITVNAAAITPVITTTSSPSTVSTTYGTPSLRSSFMVSGVNIVSGILVTPPAGFEVSINGSNFFNTVTVPGSGIIAPTPVYIRLKGTTAAGIHSGNILLSSSGAPDVNVTMPNSTVSPFPININIYALINYGDVLNDMTLIPSNFDFSVINASLKNGETATAIDVTLTGGNTGRDPVGIYNNVIHSSNLRGNNGFLLSNYTINYNSGPITIALAQLIITANNINKSLGNTLTGGPGSTDFTVTGLQNDETINTVTITYGNGAAANALSGTYSGSVVPSAAVGGNGYLASNYAITYMPGNIVVAAAGPAITTSGTLQPLTTIYGTPSLSTSFTVSGSNLTAGILVTPPAGFEVSADNIIFSNTITIGSAGTVTAIPVYIRLKQTTFAGSYFGNINLTSAGAASVNSPMPTSTVTPAPLTVTATNVSKVYGSILTGSTGSTAFVVTGLQNGETAGSVSITYTVGSVATANVGTYNGSVIASVATGGTFTAGNYDVTYQPGSITVTPASLTITADSKTKIYGDANPTLTITYQGFVNGESTMQLTTQPVAATTATQASDVGVYPITVSGGSSPNYTLSYVDGTLTVYKDISIPNAFTPNGDGINDTWKISNLNPSLKITVEIMNRYGTRVYNSIGNSASWDGYSNGVPVPFGVYYYVIKGVKEKPLTGYITVIR